MREFKNRDYIRELFQKNIVWMKCIVELKVVAEK